MNIMNIMNKKDIVTIEELTSEPIIIKDELVGSYGGGSHKSLTVMADILNCNIEYEVYENGKIVATFSTLSEALNLYNKLD